MTAMLAPLVVVEVLMAVAALTQMMWPAATTLSAGLVDSVVLLADLADMVVPARSALVALLPVLAVGSGGAPDQMDEVSDYLQSSILSSRALQYDPASSTSQRGQRSGAHRPAEPQSGVGAEPLAKQSAGNANDQHGHQYLAPRCLPCQSGLRGTARPRSHADAGCPQGHLAVDGAQFPQARLPGDVTGRPLSPRLTAFSRDEAPGGPSSHPGNLPET